MKTLDLKKDLKAFYQPSAKKVEFIQVPRFNFLMIDGAIEPGMEPGNSPLFEENMQALYGVAYTLKFTFKKRAIDPVDYPVMALEGLWDARDGKFDINVKDNWDYTLMILVPEIITPDQFEEALAQMRKKKGDLPDTPDYGLTPSKKVPVCRPCTWARMRRNWPRLRRCRPSCRKTVIVIWSAAAASITKSTWVTRARQPQTSSRPSYGIRSRSNMLKEYNGRVPPCGVFCGGCPTFLKEKKPCPGAEISQRCESRGCRYFLCCTEKGVAFCHQCDQYPCRRFKGFARNWLKYGQDFLENQSMLKEVGVEEFLQYWNQMVDINHRDTASPRLAGE